MNNFPTQSAFTLDKVNVTLPAKSFQFVIFPIAKERGYMKEEGIDLNIVPNYSGETGPSGVRPKFMLDSAHSAGRRYL
jgi:ABC-type nitrate/sulfonate/bicarbonate transport system substrate-binding protein